MVALELPTLDVRLRKWLHTLKIILKLGCVGHGTTVHNNSN